MLVLTGWKLVNVSHVRELFRHHGVLPAVIWAATLIVVVAEDLLTGVLVGIGLSLSDDARRDGRISAASISRSPARTVREARPHAASADELTRHAEFVRGLKDPIWNRAA